MATRREVVVTGVGVVSPIGIGAEAFWAALIDQRSGIRDLTLCNGSRLPWTIGGEVVGFEPQRFVRPRKSLKVMSRDIQLAFAAAELACGEAGLGSGAVDPDRLGVVFGAELIPCDPLELAATVRRCLVRGEFDFSRWGDSMEAEMHPLWMLKYLPNMPACHIGIARDARGPNNSLTLGEVSGLAAMAEAVRVIECGRADAMIAGGTSSRVQPITWSLSRAYPLSRRIDDPTRACRPFDAERDGMVHGEGAAAFVLEERHHAKARGAAPLARIVACTETFAARDVRGPLLPAAHVELAGHGRAAETVEPAASRRPDLPVRQTETEPGLSLREPEATPDVRLRRSSSDALVEAVAGGIRQVLARAGWGPETLGHVNAHGLGTVEDDCREARAIRTTLGDVPVTALKGFFGNLGAGTGAVEAAASVLALGCGLIPPTLNYRRPDPQCPLRVVHDEPLSGRPPSALLLNQSRLGHAVALLLDLP